MSALVDRIQASVTLEVVVPFIILAALFVTLALVLLKAQTRPDFDVANFLRDENGKESATRAFAFVALGVTSWVMATLTMKGQLTPDYFFYYNLTWANTVVLIKLAERWSGNLPFASGGQPAQSIARGVPNAGPVSRPVPPSPPDNPTGG